MVATHQVPVYDLIGGQYRRGRREDPRIAAPIWAALQDASPVVNVGAGSGSYEPRDRPVVAAEPSTVMLSQRPRAYLDPQIWRPMSALALITDADREHGLRRLQADLASGEWHRRWGHLLALDELDLGYRILIARP